MPPARTYPRIEGPKRQPDGTFQILVHRSPDDVEQIAAESLEKAQQTIAFLQKAKALFTPSKEQVLARATGRKPKLTPRIHKAIVKRVRDGCPNIVAAQASGISERTFYRWTKMGREATDEKDIYWRFQQDILVAVAECEHQMAQRVVRSADLDWRAAEAFLKRHPHTRGRWGDRELDGGESVTVIFQRPEQGTATPSDELVADETDQQNKAG